MNRITKIALTVLAVPVVFIGGTFLYGMYLGATGQEYERSTPVATEEPVVEQSPIAPERAPRRHFTPLPDPLDSESAVVWIEENKLIWMEAETLHQDAGVFADLSLEVASKLHHAIRKGGKEAQPVRLHFFAMCGSLELDDRRAFAEEVGAVYAPSFGATSRGYIGDFTKLFWMQTRDSESVYARGVRAFSEVVTTKELSQALIDFGTIDERVEHDSWITHVEDTMQEFDSETLLALSEAVKLGFFRGDTKYLKRYLAEFAEVQRASEGK